MPKKILHPLLIWTFCLCGLATAMLAGCKKEEARGRGKDTVTITEPAWDSLTYPLRMTAYYATVSSEKQVARLSLRIDVYRNGEAVQQTTSTVVNFHELGPLELSSAIYFKKGEDGSSGHIVMAFGKEQANVGYSGFGLHIPDMTKTSRALQRFNPHADIDPNGITPLFAIACNADSYAMSLKTGSPAESVEQLARYYGEQEKAFLLVFSLEASQELRGLKQVGAQ